MPMKSKAAPRYCQEPVTRERRNTYSEVFTYYVHSSCGRVLRTKVEKKHSRCAEHSTREA